MAVPLVEERDLDGRRQVQAELGHNVPDNPLATVTALAVLPIAGNGHGLGDLAIDHLDETIAVPIPQNLNDDGLLAPYAAEATGGVQGLEIGSDFSSHGGISILKDRTHAREPNWRLS